jgi:hypothetical protein
VNHTRQQILSVLDACCDAFTFPMLDNGYVYLAATRLSLFRSADDWAVTIEVFGFSPRAGLPDTSIYTFASSIHNRKRPEDYVNRKAFEMYLANNPHNESRSVYPIAEGEWLDDELIAESATEVLMRGQPVPLPKLEDYRLQDISLQDDDRVHVFELCRYLADLNRDRLLATPSELRGNISPDMKQILQLDEWHHPNVADDSCRPGGSETFQQLAEVLVTGDARTYQPTALPNTHWRNWPEGGTL